MNKRIKEIASQVDACYILWQMDAEALEKFTELILEECRYVMDCNKGSDQSPEWNRALFETSEKIKQHFGVK